MLEPLSANVVGVHRCAERIGDHILHCGLKLAAKR
jgi:hypothetical protein